MFRTLGAFVALLLAAGTPAFADEPLALVESISAPVPGVAAMTYASPGTVIDLGKSAVLVLDYLGSCVRETVTGGVVHVGRRFSQVENGSVSRTRLNCDGGTLQTAANTSQGGVVYRAIGPALVIKSTAPVIVAAQPGKLTIMRFGQDTAPVFQAEVPNKGAHGPFVLDLGQAHVALARGAIYEAHMGKRVVTFRIDPSARGADVALLQRLLPI